MLPAYSISRSFVPLSRG